MLIIVNRQAIVIYTIKQTSSKKNYSTEQKHKASKSNLAHNTVMDIAVGCYAYGNMFWCM